MFCICILVLLLVNWDHIKVICIVSGSTVEVREDCIILHLSKSNEREKIDSGAGNSCSCISVRRAESSSSLVGFASAALDVVDDVLDDVAVSSSIGAGWCEDLDKICGGVDANEFAPELDSNVMAECISATGDEDVHVHFDPEVVIIGAE